ncbi:MAG: cytochrome c-type biogenesis protein [Xanthobacteraceae bacterium]
MRDALRRCRIGRKFPGILGVLFCLALAIASPALAVQPGEIMKDPALEARARALSRDLRCMVCQNQSIDDSDAPLARDLRLLVRERIAEGDTDKQVIDFLVDRYGAFVLLKPPFEAQTLVLWLLPPALLLAGLFGLLIAARRKAVPQPQGDLGATPKLSPEEERRLAEIVER